MFLQLNNEFRQMWSELLEKIVYYILDVPHGQYGHNLTIYGDNGVENESPSVIWELLVSIIANITLFVTIVPCMHVHTKPSVEFLWLGNINFLYYW